MGFRYPGAYRDQNVAPPVFCFGSSVRVTPD
jgi:hypothetical protein